MYCKTDNELGWLFNPGRRKPGFIKERAKWQRTKAKRIREIMHALRKSGKKMDPDYKAAIREYRPLRLKLGAWKGIDLRDVLAKFGPSPVCYITGAPIDWKDPKSYSLDHIKPRAKGGPSTLDNMGLIAPKVNMIKRDFPLGEFLALCRLVAGKNPETCPTGTV